MKGSKLLLGRTTLHQHNARHPHVRDQDQAGTTSDDSRA